MDNEQQSVSSDTELESGTQSNVSDVVQEVQCENLGAEGQEMLPLPPSDSVDSGNTVPSASTGHGPESGEVSEVQSLRVMFERMLNFQAEFVRVQAERDRERDAKQAERDRERDAKQAERDRERDAEQAERDQRLVAEFACMQAERDRERDAEQAERDQRLVAEFAKQAERDRERDAKQAERDRRLHERDLQLMQTLEVMQSEIVSLKQKYETIPKTVQELSERVDSVQVANANIVEEISVLTNRVEQLEIDTTQVIENKVIEQVHKVENEVIKEIDQKVHAAIEARDVGSSDTTPRTITSSADKMEDTPVSASTAWHEEEVKEQDPLRDPAPSRPHHQSYSPQTPLQASGTTFRCDAHTLARTAEWTSLQ
ncbi:putative uncharacterized protein DDB_G0271982 [Schistocerca piceifrons]|uniref:putative uncharacterized protein DDB_G0271982 n=1 Tax=Schistocerca piceifrons TaxID=274613 RepID=UPI001F5F302B|nr:putative uncharacterized protein DDB_G0271982 [Schistocerca piceifrons]